jgi:hypothetical protein
VKDLAGAELDTFASAHGLKVEDGSFLLPSVEDNQAKPKKIVEHIPFDRTALCFFFFFVFHLTPAACAVADGSAQLSARLYYPKSPQRKRHRSWTPDSCNRLCRGEFA